MPPSRGRRQRAGAGGVARWLRPRAVLAAAVVRTGWAERAHLQVDHSIAFPGPKCDLGFILTGLREVMMSTYPGRGRLATQCAVQCFNLINELAADIARADPALTSELREQIPLWITTANAVYSDIEALFLEGGGICSDWPRYISDRLHRAPRLLDLHMCMTVKATAFIDLEVLRRLAAAMQAPNLFGELVAGMRKLRGDPPPPNVALLASLRLAASRQPSMAAGQRTGERGVANAGVARRPRPQPGASKQRAAAAQRPGEAGADTSAKPVSASAMAGAAGASDDAASPPPVARQDAGSPRPTPGGAFDAALVGLNSRRPRPSARRKSPPAPGVDAEARASPKKAESASRVTLLLAAAGLPDHRRWQPEHCTLPEAVTLLRAEISRDKREGRYTAGALFAEQALLSMRSFAQRVLRSSQRIVAASTARKWHYELTGVSTHLGELLQKGLKQRSEWDAYLHSHTPVHRELRTTDRCLRAVAATWERTFEELAVQEKLTRLVNSKGSGAAAFDIRPLQARLEAMFESVRKKKRRGAQEDEADADPGRARARKKSRGDDAEEEAAPAGPGTSSHRRRRRCDMKRRKSEVGDAPTPEEMRLWRGFQEAAAAREPAARRQLLQESGPDLAGVSPRLQDTATLQSMDPSPDDLQMWHGFAEAQPTLENMSLDELFEFPDRSRMRRRFQGALDSHYAWDPDAESLEGGGRGDAADTAAGSLLRDLERRPAMP